MEMLQAVCGLLIITIAGTANMSSTNETYNIITVQNNNTEYFYNENEDNVTKNLNEHSTVFSEIDDINNPIFSPIIHKSESNTSMKISNESEIDSGLSSVFDLARYNNNCGRTPEKKVCFIQQNKTEKEEAELCRQYVNIIRLAYVFSCYDNVPGNETINATNHYIQNVTMLLKANNRIREYYTKSISDVEKIARVVQMTDSVSIQGVKAYSLPHSPPDGFHLVPIQIPIRYKEHEIYILEVSKYLNQTENLSDYIRENNLINIFPYLYEILLHIVTQQTETNFPEDLNTLATLEDLYQKYKEFINAYSIFDIVVLGSAGILFFIGIILNVILLAVFIRFKETRTAANAMLINLVIIDCISLVFNLLIYYVVDRIYYQVGCIVLGILVVTRHVSYIVSVYSVVIISFQRYRAVSKAPIGTSPRCKLGVKTNTTIMICGVWAFAMLYSLPNFAFMQYNEGDCVYNPGKYEEIVVNVQFCVLSILPLVLVAIFSIMASYKLRESIKTLPGERIGLEIRVQRRMVSSRILLGLILLCVISYIPHHVASYFYYYHSSYNPEISLFRMPSVAEYVTGITYNVVHLNSCFNPLVLYFLSSKFKKYFHEIICVCKSKRTDKHEPNTNSTVL